VHIFKLRAECNDNNDNKQNVIIIIMIIIRERVLSSSCQEGKHLQTAMMLKYKSPALVMSWQSVKSGILSWPM
jgi:hypothetical protein